VVSELEPAIDPSLEERDASRFHAVPRRSLFSFTKPIAGTRCLAIDASRRSVMRSCEAMSVRLTTGRSSKVMATWRDAPWP
jgi:hypothetical protein